MTATDATSCLICHKQLPPSAAVQRAVTGRVCRQCFDRYGASDGIPLLDLLDDLDVPVLALDSDMEVKLANKPLRALFAKACSTSGKLRGGDVYECAYARTPEGCGQTTHCSGCAIRLAVTETFLTGRSLSNISACVDHDLLTQTLQMGMVISTEKVHNMVLLRIDHVGPRVEGVAESRKN